MQEVAGERGGYLHGRGALDSDDLLYLKEQMEAEEDAERLLRRTEKRAFAAFKKAAILADSTPASLPLPLRVEPKPKSGIRQQDLLKNIMEIKPKRQRLSSPSNPVESDKPTSNHEECFGKVPPSDERSNTSSGAPVPSHRIPVQQTATNILPSKPSRNVGVAKPQNAVRSLLGLSYESSDED